MKKSRKLSLIAAAGVVLVVAGAWGFSTLNGASATIDPSRLATVERGTMTPVGRRHRQDRADHQGRDQVEGQRHHRAAARRRRSGRAGRARCSPSSTRRILPHASARPAPTCRPPRRRTRRRRAAEEERDRGRGARRRVRRAATTRARSSCSSRSWCRSRRSTRRGARSSRRRTASAPPRGQLVIARARVAEATANVAQARAAVERAEEELANATIKAPIRATVLTRDVEIGSPVSSILNLGANATLVMTLGDIEQVFVRGKVDEADIGRVRLGQAARITTETFRDRVFDGTRHADLADRRREGQRHDLRGRGVDRQPGQGAEGQHDGQRRDHPRGARPTRCSFPRRRSPTTTQRNAFVDVVDPARPHRPPPRAGQGRRRQRHADPGPRAA